MVKYIILAGGSGSRLWPYSRTNYPKQILKLFNNKSLLQETCERIDTSTKTNLHVVTNCQQKYLIQQDLAEINLNHAHLIIDEPAPKNTAAAICLAALQMNENDVMVVLPSDHIIREKKKFNETIERSIELAKKGFLVTIGIKPQYPETGYGYISAGDILTNSAYRVDSFKEKPNYELAESYFKSGNYFWNSGIFIWTVESILTEFKKLQAKLFKKMCSYISTGNTKYFFDIESISIDYGILEKSNTVVMERASFTWSDLGSWKSVFDIQDKNKDGNVINGDCELIGVKNSFVLNTTNDRMIALIGIDNISVIDTDDATVICNNNCTQNVKDIVHTLKEKCSEKVKFHKTVYRPWGFYKVLEDTDYFKSKRLVVYPKQSISLQYHNKRNETWTIVKGEAEIINGDKKMILRTGETVYIPSGNLHRIRNKKSENVELIEVQTGNYFGEDDIVRIEDKYDRIK